MTKGLKELAQERLASWKPKMTVEGVWTLSALRSTAEGRLVEPETETLKQLTDQARVWDGVSRWLAEDVWLRIAAVVASHRLAMIQRDDEWLTKLYACWEAAPEDVEWKWRLRAEGEIGLALGPAGPRPSGWNQEEFAMLEEESFLAAAYTPDRVWWALAVRDFEAARQALTEYELNLATLPQKWEAAPREGLRRILTYPDVLFQIERRALAALLDRARP